MKKIIISEEEIPVQIGVDTSITRKPVVVIEALGGRLCGEFCPPNNRIVIEVGEDWVSGTLYPSGAEKEIRGEE